MNELLALEYAYEDKFYNSILESCIDEDIFVYTERQTAEESITSKQAEKLGLIERKLYNELEKIQSDMDRLSKHSYSNAEIKKIRFTQYKKIGTIYQMWIGSYIGGLLGWGKSLGPILLGGAPAKVVMAKYVGGGIILGALIMKILMKIYYAYYSVMNPTELNDKDIDFINNVNKTLLAMKKGIKVLGKLHMKGSNAESYKNLSKKCDENIAKLNKIQTKIKSADSTVRHITSNGFDD